MPSGPKCTVAIVANPQPQDLRSLPQLRWVHSVWAGVERMLADSGDTDLKIVRLVDPQLADTMAEAVLAWTLYLHRDMPRYLSQQRQRTVATPRLTCDRRTRRSGCSAWALWALPRRAGSSWRVSTCRAGAVHRARWRG